MEIHVLMILDARGQKSRHYGDFHYHHAVSRRKSSFVHFSIWWIRVRNMKTTLCIYFHISCPFLLSQGYLEIWGSTMMIFYDFIWSYLIASAKSLLPSKSVITSREQCTHGGLEGTLSLLLVLYHHVIQVTTHS